MATEGDAPAWRPVTDPDLACGGGQRWPYITLVIVVYVAVTLIILLVR